MLKNRYVFLLMAYIVIRVAKYCALAAAPQFLSTQMNEESAKTIRHSAKGHERSLAACRQFFLLRFVERNREVKFVHEL